MTVFDSAHQEDDVDREDGYYLIRRPEVEYFEPGELCNGVVFVFGQFQHLEPEDVEWGNKIFV